ncbi:DUF484 family protein [Trinickia caryophylli]|uniref:DUF484 domain-containing protein n=1 Tax=Trinickia caryophylli TaxID=28094 RepID=A0A1X7FB38_TRICW|nr:DUF484 family protein [Trinickia caryophylli]PMS10950.1 DUF484 domain-containing protein [Trinickia caryophylli]TRX18897.1 DUF484 family protein [Trinickia caryophylli]WQE10305.1 DUF484 family protein [Trinickia caryophylli]SMF49003.1 hypothetical protein SAMN06295900_108114 [Trinickia caryophylli]GLU34248.1 hypothetical protein Busp01_40900 [Trinickia caryophylli]
MNDREVAEFLLANPEFFSQHAELLAAVRLANPHGKAAVSLQERQMEMLREKNKVLERRLAELLRYGHENDSIAAKFNRWTARVIAERDAHALPRTVTQGLTDVFEVPHAALRLWDVAETYSQAEFARQVGEEVRIFANSLTAPYCGANTGFEAAQWLAAAPLPATATGTAPAETDAAPAAGGDDEAAGVQSVALIALRDPLAAEGSAAFGLLVMGSPDPRRFHEGMATDFLMQIGTLASAALSRLLAH